MQYDCYVKNYFTRACIDSCPFRQECDSFDEVRTLKRRSQIQAELDADMEVYRKAGKRRLIHGIKP